jgi:hypothetical protein
MTQQTVVDYTALLASGSKAKSKRPPILLLYGEKKIGKTTFGAAFPKPAFLCGEDGAHGIADFRWPNEGWITSWTSLLNYTRAFVHAKHDFKTIVADTLGPLSAVCLEHVVAESKKGSWEKMGWGKEEDLVGTWRVWMSLLERCRNERGMNVVLLAHAVQAGVQDSQHGDKYYVWQGDMHRAIWNATSNWADIVLYAAKERALHDPGEGIHTRAVVKDNHWIYTAQTSADYGFEAGVRGGYRLTPKFLLSYDAYNTELNETAEAVRQRILALAKAMPATDDPMVKNLLLWATPANLATFGDDINKLRALENQLKEAKEKKGSQ